MQSEHELAKINRFRILLMQHLDDLDDILDVCGRMPGRANRYQFGAYLRERLPDLKLTPDTEDFLFSQFDVKWVPVIINSVDQACILTFSVLS